MSRFSFLLLTSLVSSLAAGEASAADVKALLREADAFRLTADSMRVDTEVRVFKGGQLDKTRLYHVYVKPGRRSLVVFRSPAERGQKMLMLGDDFWLVLPASQRPLRITPLQKLLGDASTGDIASLTWAEDYDGGIIGEALVEGVPCLKLDITGQRKGVSYPRIVLYLAKSDRRPVQAELYVASDKLAKEAAFRIGEAGGRKVVTSMTLTDRIQRERRTEVHYLARTPKALGDEFYNPAFLVRADIEQ
jgi:hypothetical protein